VVVAMAGELRVLDLGSVSPLRSQTLWHAVASECTDRTPPTLLFCRTRRPYVCLGYHRSLAEVDVRWCRDRRLPIYRRMAGGGVVYLDRHQLLFQLVVPRTMLASARAAALRTVLGWMVPAFVAAGLDAHLDELDEICVGDRKVCGHGAVEIGDAVAVVGNLLGRFDHAAATRVLALPDDRARTDVEQAMRRYVAVDGIEPDAAAFVGHAVRLVASRLGRDPVVGTLTTSEQARTEALDRTFRSRRWIVGPGKQATVPTEIKIRAGVHVATAARGRSGRHVPPEPSPGSARPTEWAHGWAASEARSRGGVPCRR
jgi:lipoate-protein ligase A